MAERPVEDAAGSWLIGLIATALVLWAATEFVGFDRGGRAAGFDAVPVVSADPGLQLAANDVVEMHRLLPDATGAIGRTVLLAGTVVGEASPVGFWVRDLRDNIVFVSVAADTMDAEGQARPELRAGDPVRVRGVVTLLPPDEQAERLAGAGLVLPATAVVVRDVKIQPVEGGVEVL